MEKKSREASSRRSKVGDPRKRRHRARGLALDVEIGCVELWDQGSNLGGEFNFTEGALDAVKKPGSLK